MGFRVLIALAAEHSFLPQFPQRPLKSVRVFYVLIIMKLFLIRGAVLYCCIVQQYCVLLQVYIHVFIRSTIIVLIRSSKWFVPKPSLLPGAVVKIQCASVQPTVRRQDFIPQAGASVPLLLRSTSSGSLSLSQTLYLLQLEQRTRARVEAQQ